MLGLSPDVETDHWAGRVQMRIANNMADRVGLLVSSDLETCSACNATVQLTTSGGWPYPPNGRIGLQGLLVDIYRQY